MDARILRLALCVAFIIGFAASARAQNENWVDHAAAPAGSAPSIIARGQDTNVGLFLTPKGTGNVAITSGALGIGTTTPQATLDVNGPAILGDDTSGDSTTTCSTGGELRWNVTSSVLQFCNGTNWVTVNSAGSGGITPGCGASGTLSTQQETTLNVTAGCTVLFKVWGGGGAYSSSGAYGGGGGYASITLGPLASNTTYYLVVGGGGLYAGTGGAGLTGYTGGAATGSGFGGGGGAASGVWTGSYGGTAVVVAGGGGGGGYPTGAAPNGGYGYPGGTGPQESAGVTTGGGTTQSYAGAGGAGYTTGGLGGSGQFYGGSGGSNYAATGGTTASGSGTSPGNAGDSNLPTNAGVGGISGHHNGYDGAIYYSTY